MPNSHFHHMEPRNNTQFSKFLLLGLSEELELQPLIFGLFLSMYLITVFGNLLIILAVSSDSHLHTSMYFFLSNLSFVDICFISTTIPKMLWNIQMQSQGITYEGCITQMYFYILFAGLDDFLLAVMAYDRYVAICHPLHYTVIMNPWLCGCLVLGSWVISATYSLLHSLMVLHLSFCSDLEIHHFFCETKQLVQLACYDTFLNNTALCFGAVIIGGGPLTGILYSYSKIVSSICRISSANGKYKAFSTCVSHLSIVSLFYFSGLGVYLSSAATHSSHSRATDSVMYTVVTPMLNPFIYSLRNKDIKRALRRFFGMETFIKRPFSPGLKNCPWHPDWKPQNQELWLCGCFVIIAIVSSIDCLVFPFLWFQLLYTIKKTKQNKKPLLTFLFSLVYSVYFVLFWLSKIDSKMWNICKFPISFFFFFHLFLLVGG